MKKVSLIMFVLISFTIHGENRVSITTKSDKVIASITLNESEYITLNDQFVFLFVESNEYNFVFSGYPDGELQDNGDIYYSKELVLEGTLTLKDGIQPDNYNIEVVLGFQTCDKEGICNIPVEISEEIMVKSVNKDFMLPVIIGLLFVVLIVLFSLFKRKKS